jgi:glutathione S-transferase
MLTLHQFPRAFGLANPSPYCLKVETYLRLTQIPHAIDDKFPAVMRRAPKGKVPYISDGQGEWTYGDSSLILDYLKRAHGDPLDRHLTPTARAEGVAFTRLMEEHLVWTLAYSRWQDAAGFATTRDAFFDRVPRPLRGLAAGHVRRKIAGYLHGHGMGRHRPEEIHEFARVDVAALADFLGDKPYFLGATATTLDCAAYAVLANLIAVPFFSPVERCARDHDNLVAYCQRLHAECYPDLPPLAVPKG